MILACLALFVASTGTSIAAGHYLITSTKQIKPSVLTKLKGAKGPAGAKGATGAIGATGATGAAGAAGVAGAAGATHVVTRYVTGAWTTGYAWVTATCVTGEVATGGGVAWQSSGLDWPAQVAYSSPVSNSSGVPYAWQGEVMNYDGVGFVMPYVYVICASP
jgi:hypothetical protein